MPVTRVLLPSLLLAACSPADDLTDPGDPWVWTEQDSPVVLDETLEVPEGQLLRIEPGVEIQLGPDVDLVVRGSLEARGTEAAPVLFTAAVPDEAWGSVIFEATSIPAAFVDLDVYDAGSILEHAVFELGVRAVQLRGASPYLVDSVFRDNLIGAGTEQHGGAGLQITDGSTARVRRCTFERNAAELFAFGGAVFVASSDPILQENLFVQNRSTYGGGLAVDLMASPIVGNTFEENDTVSEGGAMALVSSVSAVLDNVSTRNHAVTDGAGIHVCVTCYPHATPFLMDNVVFANTSDNPKPKDGAAGVGAAFLKQMVDNAVYDNLRDGQPSDFGWFHHESEGYPSWAMDPDISGNWWGTTDLAAVEDAVFDGTDASGLGVVQLEPLRSAAPSGPIPRVTVTSRKLRYVDAGDEMPVFLTLYNPGPERAVELEIEHEMDGVAEVWDGALAYPGAERRGEVWTLSMPENSVYFAQIETGTYAPPAQVQTGHWRAALRDAATGDLIGVESVAPVEHSWAP